MIHLIFATDYMDSPSTSTLSPVNLSTAPSNDGNLISNASTSTAGPSNLSTFGGCNSPYKIQRQQQPATRERKRVVRSAPNG